MSAKLKASVSMLALGVAMASGSALAYQQGDIVLRAGAAMVDPDESSSTLRSSELGAVPGTGVEVDDNTQLGLTGLYMVSNNVGIELLAATPFSHTVTATGMDIVGGALGTTLSYAVEVADVKHLPPTLSVQYFPLSSDSAFQPYVGMGLNYTTFFDEEATSLFESVVGQSSVKLEDSVGFAFQVGCDYALSENLLINAAVWAIDIDTQATIKTPSPAGTIKVDVDIDPYVYMVGLGYKF